MRHQFPHPSSCALWRYPLSLLAGFLLIVGLTIHVSPTYAQEPDDFSTSSLSALPSYGERLGEPPQSQQDRDFDQLVDQFLFDYFKYYPTRATNVGIHEFDHELRPTSAGMVRSHISLLRKYETDFARFQPEWLSPERRFDQIMLLARIQAMLLEYEEVQRWKKYPGYYVGIISSGVNSLLKRDYRPLDSRAVSLIARLEQTRRVLREAQENLENPPKIYVEISLSQAKGLQRYLRDLVPAQIEAVEDQAIRDEFAATNAEALSQLESFLTWMNDVLLPSAAGNFALGAEIYRKKLLLEEGVDTPLDLLLERAEAALIQTQKEMAWSADEIEPKLSARDALDRLAEQSPGPDELIPTTQAGLTKIREFVVANQIMSVPESENIRVAATPLYRRSLSFASMDSPGILETAADEAYFYVTPPDPTWSQKKQRDHLTYFNPYLLEVISIHEAYPGHYYQFLALRDCRSLVRALFGSRSNSEGWAHYCEQMMVDAGYGEYDPRYRVSQLSAALKRICRYIVGISLHTQGMTYEEAVIFFEEQGYMTRVNSEREARRGTIDPTYLVYTLGKWEILDLRQAYEERMGGSFRLGEFHDRFLTYGRAPIPLIRAAMLPDPASGDTDGERAEGVEDLGR